MPFFGSSHFGFIALSGVAILLLFVMAARLVRADSGQLRRVLLGAGGAAIVNVGVDVVAHEAGWWRYTEVTTRFGPLGYYLLAGLGFAALALLFWRLERRFGPRALVVMLPVVCIYGAFRDQRVAERTGLMEFSAGLHVVVADGLLEWGLPFLVAVAISARAFRPPTTS